MHEHLDEFQVINMNARLYDPVIGRFLSPDRYVADPSYSQDFNRYSYARNNPLIYTDPDGEWAWLVIAGYFAVTNAMKKGVEFSNNGQNFWKGFGISMATSVVTIGVSYFAVPFAVNWLNITGAIPTGLMYGGSTFGTSALTSGATSWAATGSFNVDWKSAAIWGGISGLMGGYSGYMDAQAKGVNPWTGVGKFDLSQGYSASGAPLPEGKRTVTGRHVGKIEDVNVYESKHLGKFGEGYSGVTIPERGIIVGRGVYKGDWDMIQHEFGHVLQYRLWGSDLYWSEIAPTSVMSILKYSDHYNTWTEWSANYLSYHHLGQPANWSTGNPIWPTINRPGILPPFVRGPLDFKFNWLDIKK